MLASSLEQSLRSSSVPLMVRSLALAEVRPWRRASQPKNRMSRTPENFTNSLARRKKGTQPGSEEASVRSGHTFNRVQRNRSICTNDSSIEVSRSRHGQVLHSRENIWDDASTCPKATSMSAHTEQGTNTRIGSKCGRVGVRSNSIEQMAHTAHCPNLIRTYRQELSLVLNEKSPLR